MTRVCIASPYRLEAELLRLLFLDSGYETEWAPDILALHRWEQTRNTEPLDSLNILVISEELNAQKGNAAPQQIDLPLTLHVVNSEPANSHGLCGSKSYLLRPISGHAISTHMRAFGFAWKTPSSTQSVLFGGFTDSLPDIPVHGLPSADASDDRRSQVDNFSGLASLIMHLYRTTFTGCLVLTQMQSKREVFFLAGFPVHVRGAFVQENLGRMLFRHGRISRLQYKQAQDLMKVEGIRQGHAFLRLGVIDVDDLHQALSLQTKEKLCHCFGWTQAQFELTFMDTLPKDISLTPVDPVATIWQGVSRLSTPQVRAGLRPKGYTGHWKLGAATSIFVGRFVRYFNIMGIRAQITSDPSHHTLAPHFSRSIDHMLYTLIVLDLLQVSDRPMGVQEFDEVTQNSYWHDDAALDGLCAQLFPRNRLELEIRNPPRVSTESEITTTQDSVLPDTTRQALLAEDAYDAGLKSLRAARFKEARQALEKASQLAKTEPDYRVALAEAIYAEAARGKAYARHAAMACLQQAIRLEPGHVEANLKLAEYFADAGLADNSRPCLERILMHHPDHEQARVLLVRLLK